MTVVARRGFDATVEEIARESGVSPRTIFRHYSTQGSLILATVQDMFEACGRRPIEGLPRLEENLDGWLEVLARTIHARNDEIIGQAFWDLHAARAGGSQTLAEVAVLRREARRLGVIHLARISWKALGGTGPPPDEVVCAFALNFSPFATHALMIDFDKTVEEIGRFTADTLKVILRQAVAAQGQKGSDSSPSGDGRGPGTMSTDGGDGPGRRAMPPGAPPP